MTDTIGFDQRDPRFPVTSPWVDPRALPAAKRLAWNARPALDAAGFDEERWWSVIPEMTQRHHVMQARLAIEALIDIGALPELLAPKEDVRHAAE